MRLERSLRPLRLLRLLRSNEAAEVSNARKITQYVKCMLNFYFSRPKRLLRSLRPVVFLCLLRSLRPLKFSEPPKFLKSIIYWLESPFYDVLKKKFFLNTLLEF